MFKMNLQLFAHKKGMGSSRNGRDSHAQRLGTKRADGQFVLAGNILAVSYTHLDVYKRQSGQSAASSASPLRSVLPLTQGTRVPAPAQTSVPGRSG